MHTEAFAFVQQAVTGRTFERVLEFGSRDINGSVRPLFGGEYLGVDIEPGRGVDRVADATQWQQTGFDLVVCCELLEHTSKGADVVAAAHRALTSSGTFLATCATTGRTPHSATDGGPLRAGEYYRNVTERALAGWLKCAGFTSWDLTVRANDLYATAIA